MDIIDQLFYRHQGTIRQGTETTIVSPQLRHQIGNIPAWRVIDKAVIDLSKKSLVLYNNGKVLETSIRVEVQVHSAYSIHTEEA